MDVIIRRPIQKGLKNLFSQRTFSSLSRRKKNGNDNTFFTQRNNHWKRKEISEIVSIPETEIK